MRAYRACRNCGKWPDRDDHQLAVAVFSGMQKSPDANWNDANVSVCGAADTVGGNGEQKGYFTNTHPNGDTDFGTFEAKITTSGTTVTTSGSWRFTGGTGKFAKVTGNGVFTTRQTTPTDSDTTWSGTYNLG
jgi:hypothetical protein